MFTPFTFASVNQPGHLRRGVYRCQAELFRGVKPAVSLALVYYIHEADDEASAVDLVVRLSDGSVRARDFLWMPDRSWRDSAGTKANHLSELVPVVLRELTLLKTERLPDLHLEEDPDL